MAAEEEVEAEEEAEEDYGGGQRHWPRLASDEDPENLCSSSCQNCAATCGENPSDWSVAIVMA